MSRASLHRWIATALLLVAPLEPALGDAIEEEIDARAIALRAEDSLRADRTFMRARVTIRSSRSSRNRVIEFECWNDRVEPRSFMRVLAPGSDAGAAWLNLPPNLWRYEPELGSPELLANAALLQPWMGSDFAIADLIDPFSDVDDYEVELLRVEEPSGDATAQHYVVQYTRLPAARAAWEKLVVWIEAERGAPTRREFYDASGKLRRTIYFGDFRSVAGRRVPHRWKAVPAGVKGRESILEIRDLRFEAALDDAIFSTRNLEPAERAHPEE